MKKIIICVKEVPNTDKIQIDYNNGTLKRETTKTILNPPDENAIKWALKLKEKYGYYLVAISMGPKRTINLLEYIMSLGIDEAILLNDNVFAGSDTFATALILSSQIKRIESVDWIFFGSHSLDGDTGQVPGQVAELLNIPSYSNCKNIYFEKNEFFLEQKMEDDQKLTIFSPSVLAFLDDNKEGAIILPTAANYFTKKTPLINNNQLLNLNPDQIGLKGSPTRVVKIEVPKIEKKTEIEFFSRETGKNFLNKIKKI